MIKVLHKALDIVELLSRQGGEPVPLGRIAGALSIHQATCANILKTLVSRGLIEQVSARGGYRLGPLAYSLAAMGPYRRDIVVPAKPIVSRLATELQGMVLLTVLRANRRFILCLAQGNGALQIRTDVPYFTDAYRMATGRLLLANLSKSELTSFLVANGPPDQAWPEVAGKKSLAETLAKIRRDQKVIHKNQPDIVQLAVPVFERGRFVAALGVGLTSARYKGPLARKVLSTIREAAAEISEKL